MLNPSAPKKGINKKEFYQSKFGQQSEQIMARMTEVFALIPFIITKETIDWYAIGLAVIS